MEGILPFLLCFPSTSPPGAYIWRGLFSEFYGIRLRNCLHGGGGPQVGEVKYGESPHLSCQRDHIKMRDYMDKRVTPPKRVTSPTWGPHLHVNRP